MSTRHTVLITGGSAGIGLALATRYYRRGDEVIVTGRSVARLHQVQKQLPGVVAFPGDLSLPCVREELARAIIADHPNLDVLINNAGMQRRVGIAVDSGSWAERQAEIDVLLSAPIHLTALLTPTLLSRPGGAQIVNVTSGGAFIPQPFAPTYSAAKAALHSYTVTLRHAFESTSVRVTELIPPAVATELAGPGQSHGADVEEFANAAFAGIAARLEEVGFGPTASDEFGRRLAEERKRFDAASERFAVTTF